VILNIFHQTDRIPDKKAIFGTDKTTVLMDSDETGTSEISIIHAGLSDVLCNWRKKFLKVRKR